MILPAICIHKLRENKDKDRERPQIESKQKQVNLTNYTTVSNE